jgi:hypothetical protein
LGAQKTKNPPRRQTRGHSRQNKLTDPFRKPFLGGAYKSPAVYGTPSKYTRIFRPCQAKIRKITQNLNAAPVGQGFCNIGGGVDKWGLWNYNKTK